MSSSNTPTSAHGGSPAPPQINYQPTVRVMRLYKPGFHLAPTLPQLPLSLPGSTVCDEAASAEFTLSSFLLLPDSFGDIYAGEKFSAYIAVVNGYQSLPFYQVSLSVRLQTSTTVIDLSEHRLPGTTLQNGKTLNFNQTTDIAVQHVLNELGIHTLRVSVQYLLSPSGEPKTLRKFYRFNVLQPLVIQSSYLEINGLPMVQCEVTNATKSPVYIDEMSFVPAIKMAKFIPLVSPSAAAAAASAETKDVEAAVGHSNSRTALVSALDKDALFAPEDLHILQTGESYAFAFQFTEYDQQHAPSIAAATAAASSQSPAIAGGNSGAGGRSVGFPVVRWCTCMGEFSVYRGEDTLLRGLTSGAGGSNITSSSSRSSTIAAALKPIKFLCQNPPQEVTVGDEFAVTVRIFNNSARAVALHQDCMCQTSVPGTAVNVDMSAARRRNNSITNGRQRAGTLTGQPLLSSAVVTASSASSAAANAAANAAAQLLAEHNTLMDSSCSSMYGLCFTGLTYTALDIIDAGDYLDTTLTAYAMSAGLHELPTLRFIDAVSDEKYIAAGLCKVFVADNDEEEDDEEEEEEYDERESVRDNEECSSSSNVEGVDVGSGGKAVFTEVIEPVGTGLGESKESTEQVITGLQQAAEPAVPSPPTQLPAGISATAPTVTIGDNASELLPLPPLQAVTAADSGAVFDCTTIVPGVVQLATTDVLAPASSVASHTSAAVDDVVSADGSNRAENVQHTEYSDLLSSSVKAAVAAEGKEEEKMEEDGLDDSEGMADLTDILEDLPNIDNDAPSATSPELREVYLPLDDDADDDGYLEEDVVEEGGADEDMQEGQDRQDGHSQSAELSPEEEEERAEV